MQQYANGQLQQNFMAVPKTEQFETEYPAKTEALGQQQPEPADSAEVSRRQILSTTCVRQQQNIKVNDERDAIP
jgi:hypothetical protein